MMGNKSENDKLRAENDDIRLKYGILSVNYLSAFDIGYAKCKNDLKNNTMKQKKIKKLRLKCLQMADEHHIESAEKMYRYITEGKIPQKEQ